MASNLLPQAMFTIPRNPTQCLVTKNLVFSPLAIRRPSPNNRVLISRVSYSALSSSSALVSSKCSNRSFVVRADANPEAEPEVTETSNELVADSDAEEQPEEAEVEAGAKPPRTPRIKLGDIMGILNKRAIEASDEKRPVPDLRTGDIVELKLELPNRKRLANYKGIIISRQNAGIHTTIRIRRIIAGVGVEIVFPIYSPNIKEIKVVKHRKVRRARLYYLRDKLPRLSTFK